MSVDVGAAARALIHARRPGALMQIEARIASLIALRGKGLDRTEEGVLLDLAWQRVRGRLPAETVAGRAGWTGFDAVVAGERPALIALARGLIASLVADPGLSQLAWQVVLVRLSDDADRAMMCDWSYDVAAAAEGDLIAWVEPYDGGDWRTAGRMPVVTFEATLSTRRS
jgi:hypothetical protein